MIERRGVPKSNRSALEEMLFLQIRALKLPEPIREHRFHPTRRWRFDAAWPEFMLAVEVEGGQWLKKSRHTTGSGFTADLEKYHHGMELGWNIYRCSAELINDGRAVALIQKLIEAKQ